MPAPDTDARLPRVRFKHPVRVVPLDGQPRAWRVLSANISKKGMFLRMPEPLAPGTRVALSLEAGGRVLPFAQAEVVWRRTHESAMPGRHAGFGVRFVSYMHPRAPELVTYLVANLDTGRPLRVAPPTSRWVRWVIGAASASGLGAAAVLAFLLLHPSEAPAELGTPPAESPVVTVAVPPEAPPPPAPVVAPPAPLVIAAPALPPPAPTLEEVPTTADLEPAVEEALSPEDLEPAEEGVVEPAVAAAGAATPAAKAQVAEVAAVASESKASGTELAAAGSPSTEPKAPGAEPAAAGAPLPEPAAAGALAPESKALSAELAAAGSPAPESKAPVTAAPASARVAAAGGPHPSTLAEPVSEARVAEGSARPGARGPHARGAVAEVPSPSAATTRAEHPHRVTATVPAKPEHAPAEAHAARVTHPRPEVVESAPRAAAPHPAQASSGLSLPSGAAERLDWETARNEVRFTPKLGGDAKVTRVYLLQGPPRLVFELSGRVPQRSHTVTASAPHVRRVRVGRQGDGTRLVVDLARPPESFLGEVGAAVLTF
jgi:hypothetical protein